MIFIVKSAVASLYAEPDEQSPRVDEVLHGMPVTAGSGGSKEFAEAEESKVTGEFEKSEGHENGEWLYIRTAYRYEGWIRRCHLARCNSAEFMPHLSDQGYLSQVYSNQIYTNQIHLGQAHIDQSSSVQVCYVTVSAADVLAAPKVQAPLLICLTLGCTVHVVSEESPGWTTIALADGCIGYIRSVFLTPFPIKASQQANQLASLKASRESICRTAELYLGAQYRWGGKTPLGIDCSGLCFMAYWLNGISIYRDASIEPGFPVKEISPEQAQKGDLLFFPGHVGMLLDENDMIHSSEAGSGVGIEPVTQEWKDRLIAVGSVFG